MSVGFAGINACYCENGKLSRLYSNAVENRHFMYEWLLCFRAMHLLKYH